jgi:peptidoglycan L-alanyl-D-glutamate endopeptidase CwlK
MSFVFSQNSLDNLEGVHPDLVKVAHRALELTKVDFGVTCGLRTIEEQRELYKTGASKTMKSNHLKQEDGYSHAVDVLAYIGSRHSWELNLYDNIADAFAQSAREYGVPIRWGAAWNVPDITKWNSSMEDAMMHYIDTRRSQGRRPFIDGPHFELRY